MKLRSRVLLYCPSLIALGYFLGYYQSQCLLSEGMPKSLTTVESSTPKTNQNPEVLDPPREPAFWIDDAELKKNLVPPSDEPYNFTEYSLSSGRYASQDGQDKWVDSVFKHRTGLFAVESGAHDAERISNTVFLETHRNWTCLLVEPNPAYAERILYTNRKSWVFKGGLSKQRGHATIQLLLAGAFSRDFEQTDKAFTKRVQESMRGGRGKRGDSMMRKGRTGELTTVQTYNLHDIVAAIGVRTVDYWSLDVEGLEELVLQYTDFEKVEVGVLTIEKNPANAKRVLSLMKLKGFKHLFNKGLDMYFANPAYFEARGLPLP